MSIIIISIVVARKLILQETAFKMYSGFRDETEKIEFEAYVESRKNRFEQVVEKVNKNNICPIFRK